MQLKALRDWLRWALALRKFRYRGPFPAVGLLRMWRAKAGNFYRSTKCFSTVEYHLPVNTGLDAMEEVRHYIERHRRDIFFPFEARRTKADSGWLSPFQGEDRISIAVHCYHKDAYEFLFSHVEPIFRKAGKPALSKLNSLTHDQACSLYPDFENFKALRHELTASMLNPYLEAGVQP